MGGTLRVVAKVLRRLRPYRGLFALAVFQVLLVGMLELAKPWPLKVIVDNVLGGRPFTAFGLEGLPPRGLLVVACSALIVVYLLLGALTVTSNYATIGVGQRMVNDFRGELYAHLQRLSLAFHSRRQVGDLLYRLTADTFAIQTLTMNGFFPILTSIVLLGGMVIVMARLDPLLTVIALVVVPLLFVTIARLSHQITTLSTDARVKESALWAVAQRTIGAIRVIQAFTTEDEEHRKFVGTSRESLDANLRLYTFQTVYAAFVNVLIAGGTAAVLWVGAYSDAR
jgi:ATP-binding cassette, subfamily B, bacterial